MNLDAHAWDWRRADLEPHIAYPPRWPCRVKARTCLAAKHTLNFEYTLETDLARWRIPARGATARQDQLWMHTCFEAFVRVPGSSRYVECNFSPSSAWALYHFDAYRQGMRPVDVGSAPVIEMEQSPTMLRLRAQVSLAEAALGQRHCDYELALSAVLEDTDGTLGYWALAHPTGKPDFHHDAGFALSLRGTSS